MVTIILLIVFGFILFKVILFILKRIKNFIFTYIIDCRGSKTEFHFIGHDDYS